MTLRQAYGTSQGAWADLIGCGRSSVQRWETGDVPPSAQATEQLIAFCQEAGLFRRYVGGALSGFEVTPDYLRELLTEARLDRGLDEPSLAPLIPPAPPAAPVTPSRAPIPIHRQRRGDRGTVRRHNVPAELMTLIGRGQEIAAAQELLESARLVTLAGPGGVGKTSLALRVATALIDEYPDGVWWIELAELRDPQLIAQAIATACGVPERAGLDPVVNLMESLAPLQTLLVLDNCEHLIDGCADLAKRILRACPQVRIVTTSRQPLGITGEQILRVSPLAVPSGEIGADQAANYDAIRLFSERARSVRADFEVTPENVWAVTEICRRLDGLPLAVELAAARITLLTVEQIVERLDDRFRVLARREHADLPHHQTLRATLEWSHDQLGHQERAVFRRLGVFAGGWTLDAAEAVCAGGGVERPAVLELLARLIDKSLVQADEVAGSIRYRLLETVRQFAVDQLAEARADLLIAGRLHAEHFLAVAERAEIGIRGPDQNDWLDRLETEAENLATALAWWADRPERDGGLRLAGALHWFWYLHSHLSEGRRWLENLLGRADGSPTPLLGRCRAAAGLLACVQGDLGAAREHLDAARLTETADPALAGLIAQYSAQLALYEGDTAAWRANLERAAATHRHAGNDWGLALALVSLGHVAAQLGDPDAEEHLNASLVLFRRLGDGWGIARVLHYLGELERGRGNDAAAAAHYDECLALYRALGHVNTAASVLHNQGYLALHQPDLPLAASRFLAGARAHRQYGDQRNLAMCLAGLAGVAALSGSVEHAATLYGWAEARFRALGALPDPIDRADISRPTEIARTALGESRFAEQVRHGETISHEAAFALGESIAAGIS